MTYRPSGASCRVALRLAGLVLLSAGNAAAFTPRDNTAVQTFKFLPPVFETASLGPIEPTPVVPALSISMPPAIAPTRPAADLSNGTKINVVLENLASETSCLAEALYYEARGQGLSGEKAVAEVVVHRMNHGKYPHSICGVVHQGSRSTCQFSFVCDGTMNRPRTTGAWNRAMRLAALIIEGTLPLTNITAGAISFHAVGLTPNWRGMVRTATIGNNVFYRRGGRATN